MANSFGKRLVLTTFGESHGPAVGGVLDGFPPNIKISLSFIQEELDRRSPGKEAFSSPRKEADRIEILSGLFNDRTTGAPIAFLIRNRDARPEDYLPQRDLYRPSHADFTWEMKYGIRDYRGGGRSSARETAARVAGGAFARLLLKKERITVVAYVSQAGPVSVPPGFILKDPALIRKSPVCCPHPQTSAAIVRYLEKMKTEGDTTGGVITCRVRGVPPGLGEPVADKLQADLAKAMLGINAAKGFDYGSGFAAAGMRGSEHNDPFVMKKGKIVTSTNHSGGIQGGISNGNEIFFRVAFKPVSTLMQDQKTVDIKGKKAVLKGKGRHDVCIVPRAVPVVEAMTALVIADHLLLAETYHLTARRG